MGSVFYQSCSIDADFNILSIIASNGHHFGQILLFFFIASKCCLMFYIFRAEPSVVVEIMVTTRKAMISQRKNLMKFQS